MKGNPPSSVVKDILSRLSRAVWLSRHLHLEESMTLINAGRESQVDDWVAHLRFTGPEHMGV